MLKPGRKTSEVQTGIGSIAVAAAAIAAVVFPDLDLSADTITTAIDTASGLADSLKMQFLQYVSGLIAKYGFAGGALVFIYKVWSKMSSDRTSLKLEEMRRIAGGGRGNGQE